MPVTVEWDDANQTILRYRFPVDWQWSEYFVALQQGREMMAQVSHTVCILNDLRESRVVPPNASSVAKNIVSTRPPNTGLAVFLTRQVIYDVMQHVISTVYPHLDGLYVMARTEQEALQKIHAWLDAQSANSR